VGAVTLRDIAAEAGVSVATVSRVFSAHPRISAETRQRVLAAADALGYRSEPAPAIPVRPVSSLVGVLTPDLAAPLLATMARAIVRSLGALGYHAVVADSGGDHQQEMAALERFRDIPVAGLLVAPATASSQHLAALRDGGVPVVAFGTPIPELDSVGIDFRAGGRLAGQHLLAQGHRRVAFVDLAGPGSAECWDGLDGACSEGGVSLRPEWRLRVGGAPDDGGSQAAQKLLALRERPTAVVALSDVTTVALAESLMRAGAGIPEDFALLSLRDTPLTRLARTPLTAVSYREEEVGRLACDLLLRRIREAGVSRIEHVLLQPALNARQSTAFHRL
jgi:LacI family transcriptional regulator